MAAQRRVRRALEKVFSHPVVRKMLDEQPMAYGDPSLCLADWIETTADTQLSGENLTLSPAAANSLLHTLLASHEVIRRLKSEQDAVQAQPTDRQ